MEKKVEGTVVDVFDPPDEGPTEGELRERRRSISEMKRRASVSGYSSGSSANGVSNGSANGHVHVQDKKEEAKQDQGMQPILSPAQKAAHQNLNSIPKLEKVLVYIHPVRNAHAIIVSRDVKRFELHRMGEGVIRHWADGFVL